MTKDPITISPEDTVVDALYIINTFHIWSIPVVFNNKLIGIITKKDIELKGGAHDQKISEIMSTNPITISADEEVSVATDIIKQSKINALLVVEDTKLLGIILRRDTYQTSLQREGICYYCSPRGDIETKKLFQCKYCKEYFCVLHMEPREPMPAPFHSTNVKEQIEWKKEGGHPCVPYMEYLTEKKKASPQKIISSKPKQIYDRPVLPIPPKFPPIDIPGPPEPKISIIPTPVKKHISHRYATKLKKWFFRKNHYGRFRKRSLAIHLATIIVLSMLFWIIYTNLDMFNNVVLWIFRLGSLILLMLILCILRSIYKILKNVRYGIKGLANGYKLITALVFILICFQIFQHPDVVIRPFTQFEYDNINPFEINSILVNKDNNTDDAWKSDTRDTNDNNNENTNDNDIQPQIPEPNDPSIEQYKTGPKSITLSYIYNYQYGHMDFIVYKGLNDYLASLPRSMSYTYLPPTTRDFILRDLNNEEQQELLEPLVQEIQDITSNKDDQARIAISIVQNIPYDWEGLTTGHLTSKYPYEVLYTQTGVSGEKSCLLAFILRELGFGVAIFEFTEDNHRAVGVECPIKYSYKNSGYCFIESTQPTIITNSEGDYVGAGKLDSYDLIKICEGYSLDTLSEEYIDAIEFNRINNLISSGRTLSQYDYSKWWDVVNKYGIIIS